MSERVIKFRAYDKVNKRMGYFHPGLSWCDEYDLWYLSSMGDSPISDVPCGDNIVLMQFTGLLDCDGKEVFEGDLFNCIYLFDGCGDHRFEVVFDAPEFRLKRIGGECQQKGVYQTIRDVARYGVIGNVHQHAHLLTP
jgi:uncharacterized phage protein (TIGR01671 family)